MEYSYSSDEGEQFAHIGDMFGHNDASVQYTGGWPEGWPELQERAVSMGLDEMGLVCPLHSSFRTLSLTSLTRRTLTQHSPLTTPPRYLHLNKFRRTQEGSFLAATLEDIQYSAHRRFAHSILKVRPWNIMATSESSMRDIYLVGDLSRHQDKRFSIVIM